MRFPCKDCHVPLYMTNEGPREKHWRTIEDGVMAFYAEHRCTGLDMPAIRKAPPLTPH